MCILWNIDCADGQQTSNNPTISQTFLEGGDMGLKIDLMVPNGL